MNHTVMGLKSRDKDEAVALQSVHAQGQLQGLVLRMKLRQVYRNTTRDNLECVYTFPLAWGSVLLGMAVEGVGTWVLLSLGGVPMAALLGVLTGLLAFLPNIGAIVSGALIILVGFSAGVDVGLYAIFVYFVVQMVDGYLIVPMVAKRAVDLAPALVLGAQILFGALFGILGLALADPIIAMIKVALERQSERNEARGIREGP